MRPETAADYAAIRVLHLECFPSPGEADLVDRLRADGDMVFSLVADVADCLAGHAAFSRLAAPFPALGLGPVAVFPEWRGHGMAARLIEAGLALAQQQGWRAVFVLGEPAYYGRFGFEVGLAARFRSPYAGPAFMVRPLTFPLPADEGTVVYPRTFAALG